MHIVRCNALLGTAPGSLSRQGLYGETGGNPFAAGCPGASPQDGPYSESEARLRGAACHGCDVTGASSGLISEPAL